MANQTPIDYIVKPRSRFISNSTASGIVLFLAAMAALIIANSLMSDFYKNATFFSLSLGFS